ncbi:hypothetical protein NL676_037312 [Syzygium grande]|nr:hypothetical protein NL676_037312 [Syzygium grande]
MRATIAKQAAKPSLDVYQVTLSTVNLVRMCDSFKHSRDHFTASLPTDNKGRSFELATWSVSAQWTASRLAYNTERHRREKWFQQRNQQQLKPWRSCNLQVGTSLLVSKSSVSLHLPIIRLGRDSI